jgi:hypothetical protein
MSLFDGLPQDLQYPFSSTIYTLAAIGALVTLCASASLALFIWSNFRAFILARYFPDIFGLNLGSFGSWAGT